MWNGNLENFLVNYGIDHMRLKELTDDTYANRFSVYKY